MPTPAIAYLTRTLRAQAGIVISASHNAFEDNGIKFFSSKGAKLGDDIEFAIEAQLAQQVTTVPSDSIGKATRITDAAGRYIEFCKSAVSSSLKFNGLKVVLDCANGSTYHIAPSVFEELGAKVKAIGVDPDGLNINEQCGSTSPANLQKAVVEHQADVGIAFDGDGDRVIMVDHQGNIVDGDEILYVIARDRHRRAVEFGGVVGTKMTNLGLELALQDMQIPFARTDVGDRYVLAEMLARRWSLGGESSGHIICHDINTTGDGIVSALQAMEAVVHSDQTLAEIKQEMRKLPQTMVNVRLSSKQDVTGNKVVMAAVAEIENELGKSGRVLLRPSGTEPVIRVMVEGEDSVVVDKLARELSEVVATAVA